MSSSPTADERTQRARAGARLRWPVSTPSSAPPTADDRRSSDADLMRRVATGDAGAFESLYDRHATAAFSLARRMLRDQRSAEDVCQEAFLALWRGADGFDATRGSARAWLLAIVRNRALDALRHRAVLARRVDPREDLLDEEPAGERTDVRAIGNIQAAAARSAVAALPAEQGEVIALAYYGGLSHSEIAEALGQPLGTVKGRARLGLAKLHRATVRGLA